MNKTFALLLAVLAVLFVQIDGQVSFEFNKKLNYTCDNQDQFYYRVNETTESRQVMELNEEKSQVLIKKVDDKTNVTEVTITNPSKDFDKSLNKTQLIFENSEKEYANYIFSCKVNDKEIQKEMQVIPTLVKLNNMRLEEGEKVELKCELEVAHKNSPAEFKWFKDAKETNTAEGETSNGMVITTSLDNSILKIDSATSENKGIYKCEVKTKYGTSETEMKLLESKYDRWMFLVALVEVLIVSAAIFAFEKICSKKK